MALITPDGRYVRINKDIVAQSLLNIPFQVYKDKETRISPTEFDACINASMKFEVSQELVDSIVTMYYNEIKKTDAYSDCTDD